MRGKPPYAWEPEKGAYVGVMKRNGSAKDIVWFRAESCYVFHVMNAWEEGNRIIADVMQFEEAPLFTHPDGSPTDPAEIPRAAMPLDLRSRRQHRPLHAHLSRRPHRRIPAHRRPPRRATPTAMAGTPAPIPICRCSARCPASCMSTARASGSATICCPPATRFPNRCSSNAARTPAEGDGWLLVGGLARAAKTAAISRCSTRSDVEAGPVALVHLGHRVPDGFHGNWVGAA